MRYNQRPGRWAFDDQHTCTWTSVAVAHRRVRDAARRVEDMFSIRKPSILRSPVQRCLGPNKHRDGGPGDLCRSLDFMPSSEEARRIRAQELARR